MSVINTNINSLVAQNALARNNVALNGSLARLSTGLKINSGKDDPAGLIASTNLAAEQTGIQTAIDNAGRANNVIGTAEGGLSEVSSLLNELQGLVSQSANSGGLSSDEIGANQLQVDSVLSTINRISGSTNFQGTKLLDGNLAYQTGGVTDTQAKNIQVNSAQLISGTSKAVVVNVTQSARTAGITYSTGALTDNVTLEIDGNQGSTQISLTSGATLSSIATAINGTKGVTGVSAVASGGTLYANSTQFGASQFVSLKTISGTFVATGESGNTIKANGRDAVVSINGAAAQADGLHVSYRASNLDVSLDLQNVAAVNTANGTTNFNITGGGANFALGSKVTVDGQASIGVQSVSTGNLGDAVNGYLSSLGSGLTNSLTSNNLVTSQKIVDSAIKQVSELRGRLGAFQKFTIGSTVNALGVAYENASAAKSAITDTNFAEETSNLTRNQILSQAAQTVLSQANSQPQQVLTLLRGA